MNLEWILLGLRLLATGILYTFLGLAFYIIWRELKSVETATMTKFEASHCLRVVAAEESDLAVGQSLPLQPVTLLGRSLDNTIVLQDSATSAQHARLSREKGVWWLEDLGSRNGTLLNDLPLSKPTPLAQGDIIGIGNARLKLESSSLN